MSIPDADDPSAPPPASRLWWIVPAVSFLLLIVVAMVVGPPPDPGGHGTSYDASDTGFRAAYLILDELKFPVERSRQAVGGSVRWVLDPGEMRERDVANLDAWVRRGGLAVVAAEKDEFATRLGLTIRTTQGGGTISVTGSDVGTLDAGNVRIDLEASAAASARRVWTGVREGEKPLVTIVPHGRGEVWFLHRPHTLRNANMRHADNAVFACRLAEATLEARPGRLAFDEYVHGLRDRPGVAALLFRPPMLAVTLQALALTALVLWSVAPRFGPVRPVPPPSRRSKEEYLDAVAELLRRKGDYAEAVGTVQHDLRRRVEAALGLPADVPAEALAREAERRRGVTAETLRPLFAVPGSGPSGFLDALHQLDTLRHEFFDRPRPRR